MKLRLLLDDLKQMDHISTVIIESYDQSLYQCFVVVGEQEVTVWESRKKALKSCSLMAMRKQLASGVHEKGCPDDRGLRIS